ncbi:MAG: sigma-70 family RNA polymerase sigma factor [Clostridia bacterium]|nr:sigma-70 family RNA polymerase sigma factor [Clostridia bacterium]
MTDYKQEDIYTEYHDKVFGYIHNRIASWHDAEDICADVFVKVFSHLDSFDETKASLSTWIYTITRNTLRDRYRTTHVSDQLDDSSSGDDDFVDDICKSESLQQLADALEKLDDRQRDIVILHYYSGKTLLQIADHMSLSYSYVKVLHNKALANLKVLFG